MKGIQGWFFFTVFIFTACGGGDNPDNTPPAANAGNDQTVELGVMVTLDGSNSSDPDNDRLRFQWSMSSRPAGSQANLSSTSIPNPTFTPDLWGRYEIHLTVNDGHTDSAGDSVVITAEAPGFCQTDAICGAGGYCQKNEGQCDSTGSCIAIPDAMCTQEYNPVCGCDGQTYGNACSALISGVNMAYQGACNQPPTANAGSDHSVTAGDTVLLDGAASSDPENNDLTFQWNITRQPVGSGTTLSDDTVPNPTFIADQAGEYEISLVVNDGTSDSPVDTVIITAVSPAYCQSNTSCNTGEYCQKPAGSCDGTGSCVVIPDGVCTLEYIPVCGCDGQTYGNSCSALISGVNVAYEGECNQLPIANAGPDQRVNAQDIVLLDGRGSSDPEAEDLTYLWTITAYPAGSQASLSSNTSESPSFIADLAGAYEISLVVNDGTSDSPTDSVTVTASATSCTANADCASGNYCQTATGSCGSTGSCVPRPEACMALWAPLCGCDGQTYGNTCEAAAAGVSVLSSGGCPP